MRDHEVAFSYQSHYSLAPVWERRTMGRNLLYQSSTPLPVWTNEEMADEVLGV